MVLARSFGLQQSINRYAMTEMRMSQSLSIVLAPHSILGVRELLRDISAEALMFEPSSHQSALNQGFRRTNYVKKASGRTGKMKKREQ
jgi:hypothetical protein